jgi:hypothetical protein
MQYTLQRKALPLHPPLLDVHCAHRLLADYNARVASEGELSEEDLPAEVVETVEEAVGQERRHFAVSPVVHLLQGPLTCVCV